MFKLKIISSIIVVALMIGFIVNLNLKSPEMETVNEGTILGVTSNGKSQQIKSQSLRNPASVINSQIKVAPYIPEVKRSELDHSNFANPLAASVPVMSGAAGKRQGQGLRNGPATIPLIRQPAASNGAIDFPKTATITKENEQTFRGIIQNVLKNPDLKKIKTLASSINSSGNAGTNLNTGPNTCSSNIAGGAFNNPVGINLNCSTISTIKYCLALDTGSGCCDPLASPATYSSQIIIGPKNGNYCLSYYGESVSSGTSVTYQQSYIINSTLPNLLVAHPQIYYQTTQLAGKSIINSSEFGKVGFNIGQINLKTHDPGPAAENLDCDQIIANYVTLPTPNPLAVLSPFDVSLDNPAVQIEIPLRLDQLDYGDNFITSYIANNNFVAPIYACSTSKIVLNDFEFFQEELAFGDVGDNSVREFTGGFSSYGFFEDEATFLTASRAPAGVNIEDQTGQKLEYGLFGIFY
jgi:hypothetical protein